ncbi:hypothetical protein V8E55_005001 [Tylopilus felleus]
MLVPFVPLQLELSAKSPTITNTITPIVPLTLEPSSEPPVLTDSMPPSEPPPVALYTELSTLTNSMPPSVSQSPALTTEPPNPMSNCPRRAIWLPKRYCDKFPEPPAPVAASAGDSLLSQPVIRRVILHVRNTIRTTVNAFGIFHEYPHRPSYDPDAFVTPDDLTYRGCQLPKPTLPVPEETGPDQPPPWPF